MKRVLFITAPWSFKECYPPRMSNDKTTIAGATPPLGILYLSACLKQVGHHTGYVDGMDRALDWVVDEINAFAPDIVAFSCTTFAWKRTVDLCRMIKQDRPEVVTLVGGPHVTGVKLHCLEEGVDYGLTGDAEQSIVSLVAALESDMDLSKIKGLVYRDEAEAGKPKLNLGGFFKDLDSLPFPDYDLVDIRDYPPSVAFYNRLPSMTMMTTRGCPALCTFCDASSNFRVRSMDNVIEEIRFLKDTYDLKHILFYDEDLPLVKKRLYEMCNRFIDEDLDISWCCNSRADSIDEPMVKLMKKAGCWRILVGVESGNQETLDAIMKGLTLAEIKEKVKMIRSYGIEVLGTFIFGLPGETYEMGLKTVDFAIEIDLDYAIFLKLTPFPGTHMAQGIEKKGRLTGNWAPNLISFVPNEMTEEEMAKLSSEAIRRFYMRPAYLLKRGLKMRSWRDLERNLRGFFSFFGIRTADYMTGLETAEPAVL